MKNLIVKILLFTLLATIFCSCEKEKYPGAYPYDEITFYYDCTVGYGRTKKVIYTDIEGWDKEKYPMTFWVDNEEVASISQDGYITGKKLKGDLIVHAKVMSTRGMIEGSVRYNINDILSGDELSLLFNLGLDVDINVRTCAEDIAEELAKIKSIIFTIDRMADTTFNKISPYIKSLDTLQITTYNKSLDLSDVKIKHLIITDGRFRWNNKYPISLDSLENVNTYQTYIEPHVLTELNINKALEELTFCALPGFPTLDLREFNSLKKINREYLYEWFLIPCNIIPPTSIEYINILGANIIFENVYTSLHTFKFTCPQVKHTILSKNHMPNLKEIQYDFTESKNWFISLDISDYEFSELDYINIDAVDKIILSNSIYNNRHKYNILSSIYEISDKLE